MHILWVRWRIHSFTVRASHDDRCNGRILQDRWQNESSKQQIYITTKITTQQIQYCRMPTGSPAMTVFAPDRLRHNNVELGPHHFCGQARTPLWTFTRLPCVVNSKLCTCLHSMQVPSFSFWQTSCVYLLTYIQARQPFCEWPEMSTSACCCGFAVHGRVLCSPNCSDELALIRALLVATAFWAMAQFATDWLKDDFEFGPQFGRQVPHFAPSICLQPASLVQVFPSFAGPNCLAVTWCCDVR